MTLAQHRNMTSEILDEYERETHLLEKYSELKKELNSVSREICETFKEQIIRYIEYIHERPDYRVMYLWSIKDRLDVVPDIPEKQHIIEYLKQCCLWEEILHLK